MHALRLLALLLPTALLADGLVVRPRTYTGSLEESSQEAIIIFTDGDGRKQSAREDLILKIHVEGETDEFGWIVPLPNKPEVAEADSALFREVFDYVQSRRVRDRKPKSGGSLGTKDAAATPSVDAVVLSREIVGAFDVAVVREEKGGGLAAWLDREGFQKLEKADDVIGHYREKGYVFACIKVSESALSKENPKASLHPLRFTFDTGGRDGIYFPMKLTGLQTEPFGVNLYVFRRSWINDRLNEFGFTHHAFRLIHRDWDTDQCVPNAGKMWSHPEKDPYLRDVAGRIPKLKAFFNEHYPQERFYLTNLSAFGLRPRDVRDWKTDLWLFPYYIDRSMVPFDARRGGAAAATE